MNINTRFNKILDNNLNSINKGSKKTKSSTSNKNIKTEENIKSILRNPNDVIPSNKKVNWDKHRNIRLIDEQERIKDVKLSEKTALKSYLEKKHSVKTLGVSQDPRIQPKHPTEIKEIRKILELTSKYKKLRNKEPKEAFSAILPKLKDPQLKSSYASLKRKQIYIYTKKDNHSLANQVSLYLKDMEKELKKRKIEID